MAGEGGDYLQMHGTLEVVQAIDRQRDPIVLFLLDPLGCQLPKIVYA